MIIFVFIFPMPDPAPQPKVEESREWHRDEAYGYPTDPDWYQGFIAG